MKSIPSFYSMKLAYGPGVVKALAAGLAPIQLDDALETILRRVAEALTSRFVIDKTWVYAVEKARLAGALSDLD